MVDQEAERQAAEQARKILQIVKGLDFDDTKKRIHDTKWFAGERGKQISYEEAADRVLRRAKVEQSRQERQQTGGPLAKLKETEEKLKIQRGQEENKVSKGARALNLASTGAAKAAQASKAAVQKSKAGFAAGLGALGTGYNKAKQMAGSFWFFVIMSLIFHYVIKGLMLNWNPYLTWIVDFIFVFLIWIILKPDTGMMHEVWGWCGVSIIWMVTAYFLQKGSANFILAFLGSSLFNRYLTPIWFYYFVILKNPSKGFFQNFLKFVVVGAWLGFFIMGIYQTPEIQEMVREAEVAGMARQEIDTAKMVIRGMGEAFQGVVAYPSKMIDQITEFFQKMFVYSLGPAGDYYTGRVEENKKEKLGVYIEDIAQADPKLYTDETIVIWATLRAKTIGKPINITNIKCVVERSGKVVATVDAEPKEVPEFTSLEESDLSCVIGKLPDAGSYTVKVQAEFGFATDAYQKAYFIDDEKYKALIREDVDPFEEYKIKDKEPIAVYTNGPIGIGIETSTPLIRVRELEEGTDESRGVRLGITVENKWTGKIKMFNKLTLQSPLESDKGYCDHTFKEYTKEECNNDCDEYYEADGADIIQKCKDDCTNFNMYQLDPNYMTDLNLQNIEKYQSFSCRVAFRHSILKPDTPITTKYFRVRADYAYIAEESININVEKPAYELKGDTWRTEGVKIYNPAIATTQVDTLQELREQVKIRQSINKPYGDFRGLEIKKGLVYNPSPTEVVAVVEERVNSLTQVHDPDDKEKLKQCYLKMLSQESSGYKQYYNIEGDYYRLVASDIPEMPASGCCAGASQVYVNLHATTEEEAYNLVADYKSNIGKGFDIFFGLLKRPDVRGDLANAATKYRGGGEYPDHCSGKITIT